MLTKIKPNEKYFVIHVLYYTICTLTVLYEN